MESRVVLPAPLGPRSPKMTPRGTSRDTPRSASVARRPSQPMRNVLTTSRTSRASTVRMVPSACGRGAGPACPPPAARGRAMAAGGVTAAVSDRARRDRGRQRPLLPGLRGPRSRADGRGVGARRARRSASIRDGRSSRAGRRCASRGARSSPTPRRCASPSPTSAWWRRARSPWSPARRTSSPGAAGRIAVTSVLATNVFERTPEGWRMILHHASHVLPGGAGLTPSRAAPRARAPARATPRAHVARFALPHPHHRAARAAERGARSARPRGRRRPSTPG